MGKPYSMNKQQLEHQQGIDQFDFPCSYTFRGYYEEMFYDRYLPALEAEPEIAKKESAVLVNDLVYLQLLQKQLNLQDRILKKHIDREIQAKKKKGRDIPPF